MAAYSGHQLFEELRPRTASSQPSFSYKMHEEAESDDSRQHSESPRQFNRASTSQGFTPLGGEADWVTAQDLRRSTYRSWNQRPQFGDASKSERPVSEITAEDRKSDYVKRTADLEAARKESETLIAKNIFLGTRLVGSHIVAHPFLLFRKLCQVCPVNSPGSYHLTPLTPLSYLMRLTRRQGVSCLFRGMSTTVILSALEMWLTDLLSTVTGWPKYWPSLSKKGASGSVVFGHLTVRGLAVTILMPFCAAALVEFVSSGIASERPGPLDMFIDGFTRHLHLSQRRGQLSVWILWTPCVLYGIGHYVTRCLTLATLKPVLRMVNKSDQEEDPFENAWTTVVASFVADVCLYPLETILNRLYLQGTRTIVDCVDETSGEVLAIITRYQGLEDCYSSILKTEGKAGLFKGFGGLILQYAVQLAVLKLVHCFWKQITERPVKRQFSQQPPPTASESSVPHGSRPTFSLEGAGDNAEVPRAAFALENSSNTPRTSRAAFALETSESSSKGNRVTFSLDRDRAAPASTLRNL